MYSTGDKVYIYCSKTVEARPKPKLPLVAPKKQTSSSKKKVRFERYEALINDSDYQSEVIDLSILSQRLLSSSLCKTCKTFGLQIRSTTHVGLAAKLELYCSHCTYVDSFF